MEGVILKDYLIKDDQLFTDFISKHDELCDSAQTDLHSMIFSLNSLFPNDYEKQKFYLKKCYLHYRDAIKPHILLEYFTMQGDREEVGCGIGIVYGRCYYDCSTCGRLWLGGLYPNRSCKGRNGTD